MIISGEQVGSLKARLFLDSFYVSEGNVSLRSCGILRQRPVVIYPVRVLKSLANKQTEWCSRMGSSAE
jgi:hypothetical protein